MKLFWSTDDLDVAVWGVSVLVIMQND